MTELEGEIVNGKETVTGLNVMLQTAKKRAKNSVYEQNCLRTRLLQSQCELEKVGECTTRVQDEIDRFSADMKGDQHYMERRADVEGRKVFSDYGARMVERVVESQQIKFEAFMMTFMQYRCGWDSRVMELRRDVLSAVNGAVVLKN